MRRVQQQLVQPRENREACHRFTTQSQLLMALYKTPIENIMGKGENAGDQHFLLFPQCFLLYQRER